MNTLRDMAQHAGSGDIARFLQLQVHTLEQAVDIAHRLPVLRAHIAAIEVAVIERILDAGWTWERLATEMGRSSRQAMQQRYRRIGGTRTWPSGRPTTTPSTG